MNIVPKMLRFSNLLLVCRKCLKFVCVATFLRSNFWTTERSHTHQELNHRIRYPCLKEMPNVLGFRCLILIIFSNQITMQRCRLAGIGWQYLELGRLMAILRLLCMYLFHELRQHKWNLGSIQSGVRDECFSILWHIYLSEQLAIRHVSGSLGTFLLYRTSLFLRNQNIELVRPSNAVMLRL